MPIALNSEDEQLAESVRSFAARYAPVADTRRHLADLAAGQRPDHWQPLVKHGLHAVHLSEADGGEGGGLPALAVVLAEAGRALLPGPLAPTAIAGAVADKLPATAARSALLADLADGTTATLIGPADISASPADSGWTLTGSAAAVLGLLSAEVLIIGATESGSTRWFRVDSRTDGVRRTAADGVDLTRDIGRLDLDVVVSREAELGLFDAEAAQLVATALSCAEAAGVMAWCVRSTVEYAKVREQFGKPIGSFQAVKHKIANLFIASELAAAAAWDAVRSLDQDIEQQRLAVGSAAVVALGSAAELALDTILVFGGIGFTWEHDAHLYWRRAIGVAALAGPTSAWLLRLGRAAMSNRRAADVTLTGAEPGFRAEVAAVLDEVAAMPEDNGRTGPRRTRLADAGLVAAHWPRPWGLAATPAQQLVIAEEFVRRGIPLPTMVIGEWAMPTILAHGTAEQIGRFTAASLRGEIVWCQLFSEPGAGSDLASLATKAVKVDGGWRLNGQKVWTSSAHEAHWGICLARTDPDAPKHKGLSYFLVEMQSAGVEVRPLRQATGDSDFNEVFLTDVFVPDDLMLGDPGDGWRLTLTTLGNERATITNMAGEEAQRIRLLIADGHYVVSEDVALRSLGHVQAYNNALAAMNVRETLMRLAGLQPGAGASIGKVAAGQLRRDVARSALELAGPQAAVAGGRPVDAAALELGVPLRLLGGGTTEIQLNVIAERVLGLPRG